jgi:predicted amidohydrolase YtcJ
MSRSLLLVFIAIVFACSKPHHPADLIIKGGTIYTSNEAQPMVEAVAVVADTIVYAGNLEGLKSFEGKETQTIDLKGNTMTAGFIETHGHIMGLGYSELNLDLTAIQNYEEMVEKVKDAIAKAEPGQWIIGRGWHQDKWNKKPAKLVKGFQTHELLSKVSANNPVLLVHASGHAIFVNAKAMSLAGLNQLSVEQFKKELGEGGEIVKDELGNPTGIFNERAQQMIWNLVPMDSKETRTKALTLAFQACLKNGITTFHDAGADSTEIELFNEFKNTNKLDVRLYVMLEAFNKRYLYDWYKKGPQLDKHLTIRSIKLHCDGALGSRGAWLLEPYSDQPTSVGMATLPMDTVLKISREGLKYGFQVCSHAIGDRANKEILDRYETAFREHSEKPEDARFRIEHAQHLNPNDIPRFGKLGVIPAMQAIHLSSDRPWAINRLGEQRIQEGAYMWQSLLKSGAKVVNGSDVPVEPINPIASFYASVSRKTLRGEPEGGYEPNEKMTRQQALQAYTITAAYAGFQEKTKGSIEKGKLADFTIFSQDIMNVSEAELLKTEVTQTIVGGKVLYKKK